MGGRIVDAAGRGIKGVTVSLTDGISRNQRAITNAFGMYEFQNIPTGATYTLTPFHRRYTFTPPNRVVNHTGAVSNLNFTGN
jgi:hypothetical protein